MLATCSAFSEDASAAEARGSPAAVRAARKPRPSACGWATDEQPAAERRYRIGGAYIRPPRVQRSFAPLGSLSGLPAPRLRSNTSP